MNTPRVVLLAAALVAAALSGFAQDQLYSRIAPLETSVAQGTASRAEQLELARLFIQAGRFYEASRTAEKLLLLDPNDADAMSLRDEAKRKLSELASQRLIEAESRANRNGATDQDRLVLADAYFEAGSYATAAQMYGRVPAALMTRETRLRHARALSWSGKMDDAERIYAALRKESTTPELDVEYGQMLLWMGASRAALDVIGPAHASSPTEESITALASAHAWSGRRDEAIRLLREYTAQHPAQSRASRLLRDLEASPELRLEQVDRLIEREPFNLALRVERARLLVDAGRDNEAINTLAFVREHSSQAIEGVDDLEQRAKAHREQERARIAEELSRIDTRELSHADQILSVAKAATAVGDYEMATRLYQDYLRLRPNDSDARIAYARVLSWDQRYAAASREYQKLLEQHPDRADLRLEYAQILSWDSDFIDAVHMFSSLTDLSEHPRAHLYGDVPPRAHFNLGQIYRWYGWNEHAVIQQNRALQLDDSYVPARNELDLIRHLRPASNLEGRYTHATDSNDFTLRRLDFTGEKWTSQRTAWSASLGRHEFEHFGQSVSSTAASGGVTYRWRDRWTGRARLGLNFYESGLGTRPFWGIGAEHLPNIQSRVSLDYNHYDLIYDVFTLSSLGGSPTNNLNDAITIDDFRAHYDYNSGGFWSWLADASYGMVSDDNQRQAGHGLLTFRLLKEPFVAIKADGRVLSYDFRTPRYWSPDDYRSLAGVLHVGQNIRNRFHWSAELKYGKSWEDDTSSNLRSYSLTGVIPVNDTFDIVGWWTYGKSGRLDSILGNSGADFVNYWQRQWFVGIRAKRLFAKDDRRGRTPYYYDNSVLSGSPVIPPGLH